MRVFQPKGQEMGEAAARPVAEPRLLSHRLFALEKKPSLSALKEYCTQVVDPKIYPLCESVCSNIPIYKSSGRHIDSLAIASALQDEWYHILLSGPGVFLLKGMYSDSLLNRSNRVFSSIIASEKSSSLSGGDHFAAAGNNDRIWNSFSKHCCADAASFMEYYSNPWLALACDAWLGPAYRITAQVNIVKPGGKAQVCHRDYHLGFQTAETAARYPRAVQVASQLLTLQGAVAHTDMPLESGPTRLLPFSQLFEQGYMAFRLPEFNQYFLENYVSLHLEKGDGIFFNPALFHAAGDNVTMDLERSANLLQISSAFGKPMEAIDTLALVERCWEGLMGKYEKEGRSKGVEAFVAAITEGYPFPTNLDKRPPAPGGMAPESEQDVVLRGLKEAWTSGAVMQVLRRMRADST